MEPFLTVDSLTWIWNLGSPPPRDHIFGVFEDVLRIFGANREIVTEKQRKLHDEEIHNVYS
jgi:hypothetical protein